MERTLIGKILLGLGIVAVAAGVVGLVTSDDDTATVTVPAATTTSSSTSSTSTTSTTTSSSTTSSSTSSTSSSTTTSPPEAPAETPEEFFAILQRSLDDGDAATLRERMNDATVERYGAEQCTAYAESVAGTGLPGRLLSSSPLASWDYTTDGVTSTIADVVAAELERTINEQTITQTTHWKLVDGRYTWFTDCGTPL